MGKNKNKYIMGLLICMIIGSLIIGLDLFFSQTARPMIESNPLSPYQNGWSVSVNHDRFEGLNSRKIIENANFGDTIILSNQIPKVDSKNSCVFFRASHQLVKVYINDQLIYHFGWDEKRLFSKTPGCTWVVVPLQEEQSEGIIRVELTGVYPGYEGRVNGFYIGDQSEVLHYVVNRRAGSILICLVLIVQGITMMMIAVSIRKGRVTASLFRLGCLSTLIGIWSLCVTNVLQVFYGNVFVLLNIEFVTFGLIVPFSLWFLESFLYYREKRIFHILFVISVFLFIIIQVLQLLNLADYMESIFITHLLMLGTLLYLFVTGIKDLFTKHVVREEKILACSIGILIMFWGMDLINFYNNKKYQVVLYRTDEGFYTRIGMMIFILIWALEIIRNMSKLLEKMTRTQILEVLAYEDQMTGLKNRTAFEEKLTEFREANEEKNGYIIEFDMNDLKYINDNFGHAKGDLAITTLANLIKEEFEQIGSSYRIGGDEICSIITKTNGITSEIISNKILHIEKKLQKANETLGLHFSVACGFAKISMDEKNNIDQAYIEADKRMYEHKVRIKKIQNAKNKNIF